MRGMNRRTACITLLGLPALPVFRLAAQDAVTPPGPETYKIYTESPRLLMPPGRVRLLRRERERRSLRWEQFELLWNGNASFPELGFAAALHYQISQDVDVGKRAVLWAAEQGEDVRQIALVFDWCGSIITPPERAKILTKLQKAAAGPTPKTLVEARNKTLAAIALTELQPAVAERALRDIYENYWMKSFIPGIRSAKGRVGNADALPMLELLHAFRDNLNYDLRDALPRWFKEYPMIHIMAHYPAPWPASANEFRVPADPEILKSGPDLRKATLSRAAELAMVAFDTNSPETQVVQGFVMNDRFLMRDGYGIPYEMMWANPYQPGLSHYHIPPALHDEIGGELFVRSSWEDDAVWVGFFDGQLQLFSEGSVAKVDPKLAHEPLDLDEATVFFGREAKAFQVPKREGEDALDDVFIVGLEANRTYLIEVDLEEMREETADPGGILFLPGLPAGAAVKLNLAV